MAPRYGHGSQIVRVRARRLLQYPRRMVSIKHDQTFALQGGISSPNAENREIMDPVDRILSNDPH
jgi:hypothetical protein